MVTCEDLGLYTDQINGGGFCLLNQYDATHGNRQTQPVAQVEGNNIYAITDINKLGTTGKKLITLDNINAGFGQQSYTSSQGLINDVAVGVQTNTFGLSSDIISKIKDVLVSTQAATNHMDTATVTGIPAVSSPNTNYGPYLLLGLGALILFELSR